MAMSNSSTVQVALTQLGRRSGEAPGPVLVGFEASRHLARLDLDAPLVAFDMPICEETIVGTAIGLALAGRDVIVDLMFEGFLSRCVEPLLVGWPTALALTQGDPGRIVVRMLGGPVRFGGPSHGADVLALLDGADHIQVVHVTGPEDVEWALASAPADRVVLLADPSQPELLRGKVVDPAPALPIRRWSRDCREVTVCTHAELTTVTALVDAGHLDTDVVSSPVSTVERRAIAKVLEPYAEVQLRGVTLVDR
jgi:pyruvate/2-oxoglutarate/acetoin dehydrogenase E1 component